MIADIVLGSQIAYIGSPLVVPTWAILNVLGSLVLWIYVVTPALYYTNTWWSAYLPMQSNSIYDNTGQVFNVSKVINKRDGFAFDLEKYQEYSPVSYCPQLHGYQRFPIYWDKDLTPRNRRSIFLSLMPSTHLVLRSPPFLRSLSGSSSKSARRLHLPLEQCSIRTGTAYQPEMVHLVRNSSPSTKKSRPGGTQRQLSLPWVLGCLRMNTIQFNCDGTESYLQWRYPPSSSSQLVSFLNISPLSC